MQIIIPNLVQCNTCAAPSCSCILPVYLCLALVLYTTIHMTQPHKPGATHESSNEWLQNLSYHLYTRSVFYKGPLLSIIPEISELVTTPTLLNAKFYKKDVRKALVKYQSSGDAEEWQSGNFLLFKIPVLRKSPRNLTPQITNLYK